MVELDRRKPSPQKLPEQARPQPQHATLIGHDQLRKRSRRVRSEPRSVAGEPHPADEAQFPLRHSSSALRRRREHGQATAGTEPPFPARIDLVRRLDTDELSIVDFKSTARAQDEDVTRDQLHVYAVGYEELTGERADLIEVLNLDEEGKTIREEVEEPLLVDVRSQIRDAGDSLRENNLPRLAAWGEQCTKCDLAELCRDVPASDRAARRAASGR